MRTDLPPLLHAVLLAVPVDLGPRHAVRLGHELVRQPDSGLALGLPEQVEHQGAATGEGGVAQRPAEHRSHVVLKLGGVIMNDDNSIVSVWLFMTCFQL